MELEHRFEVPVGIDQAWTHLMNMDEVASCFPGATLTSSDGDEYTGSVKVKLGPIQLTYKGSARIAEADESAHRATIEASGKAARSGSTASMTVVAAATELATDRTEVTMTTDLTITGRPAQFGRGVMAEVGDKILGRFADCIAGKLAAGGTAGPSGDAASGDDSGGNAHDDASGPGDGAPNSGPESGSAEGADTGATGAAGPGAGERTPSYTRDPDPVDYSEPIDLLESAGTPVLKRVLPIVAGLVGFFVLRWIFKRRGAQRD